MSRGQPTDPLLLNYLDRVIDVLATSGSTAIEERAIIPLSESLADLRAAIRFYDHSYMSVWMRASVSRSILLLQRYSFHYMTPDGSTLFRYDNSDYHPDLPNPPHHKHEGANETVIDCPQPSVRQIRDEIVAHLEEQRRH